MSDTALTTPADPHTTPQPGPACRPSTALFSARHWIIFGAGALVALFLFLVAVRTFRNALDAYQMGLPRYAAERAIAALGEGKKELARQEVAALMEDIPIRPAGGLFNRAVDETWEGRVLRNRVTVLEHLTGSLLAAGMTEEAEAVGWKMQLECHISSRVLEFLDQWEWMFHVKAARQDWLSALEIMKILAAHGASHVREPGQIEPDPIEVDPTLFKALPANLPPALLTPLIQYYQSDTPQDFSAAATQFMMLRDQLKNPAVRQAVNDLIHRSLIQAGQAAAAHAFFSKLWGRDLGFMDTFWRTVLDPQQSTTVNLLDRDPTRLAMMWRDRPASSTLSIAGFMDSFRSGDPRIQIVDFNKLTRKDIGYFNLSNKLTPFGERTILSQAIAAEMPVQVTKPVHRIYIAYDATAALGVYPILLVRARETDPFTPLYCDSEKPDMAYFDIKLDGPARYNFQFVYLNDAAFYYPSRGIKENRDLSLYRMALVQVPPAAE